MFNGDFKQIEESYKRLQSHISIDSVKFNLGLPQDETDEDDELADLIEAAIDDAQDYTDHHFALTEYDYRLYNFSGTKIEFQMSPFQSIVSLEHSDDGQSWTAFDTADYAIDKNKVRFIIEFDDTQEYDYIKVVFRVGYTASTLPKNVYRAIVMKASDMYDTEKSSWTVKAENQRTYENALGRYYNRRW